MEMCLKFNAMYTLSTSPDPRHHTALLNADVLNCYIMLKFLFATNCLITELAHSKLRYLYLTGLFSSVVSCRDK